MGPPGSGKDLWPREGAVGTSCPSDGFALCLSDVHMHIQSCFRCSSKKTQFLMCQVVYICCVDVKQYGSYMFLFNGPSLS